MLRRKGGSLALAALVLILVSGCGSTEDDATDDIRAAYGVYEETILSGDADGWISNWTNDGIGMWADFPITTRSEMAEIITEELEELVDYKQFEIVVDEVVTAGDWAYARCSYTWVAELMESGEQLSWDGKCLTIFQKQSDGSWKIHRDIYNSNVPPE